MLSPAPLSIGQDALSSVPRPSADGNSPGRLVPKSPPDPLVALHSTTIALALGELSRLLDDLASFLRDLSDTDYREPPNSWVGATIGLQVRHLLDHFNALEKGISSGVVQYHARTRGASLESDRTEALRRIGELQSSLGTWSRDGECRPLRIDLDVAPTEPPKRFESTLSRELCFVQSHTIHHHALIALYAGLQGLRVPPGFGKAPGTLRSEH